MIILAILLAGACYIFIERLVVIKQATQEDKSFMDRIRDYIHEGKIDSAINLCKQTDTPSAHLIEKGISRIGRPMNDVQVAVENVGNLEVGRLEKVLLSWRLSPAVLRCSVSSERCWVWFRRSITWRRHPAA